MCSRFSIAKSFIIQPLIKVKPMPMHSCFSNNYQYILQAWIPLLVMLILFSLRWSIFTHVTEELRALVVTLKSNRDLNICPLASSTLMIAPIVVVFLWLPPWTATSSSPTYSMLLQPRKSESVVVQSICTGWPWYSGTSCGTRTMWGSWTETLPVYTRGGGLYAIYTTEGRRPEVV